MKFPSYQNYFSTQIHVLLVEILNVTVKRGCYSYFSISSLIAFSPVSSVRV